MRDEMCDGEITVFVRDEALDAVVVRLRFADPKLLEQLERGALRDAIERVVSQHLVEAGPRGRDEKLDRALDKALDEKLDRALDEALEETFPASDPVAVTAPGHCS